MVREGGLEEEVEEGLQERQESVDAASITSTNGTAHSEQSGACACFGALVPARPAGGAAGSQVWLFF